MKRLLQNIHSLVHDGRTLGQKKRYIYLHHPILYKYLYEECEKGEPTWQN